MAAFSSGYRLPMAPGEKMVVFVFLRLLQLLGMEAIMRAIVVGIEGAKAAEECLQAHRIGNVRLVIPRLAADGHDLMPFSSNVYFTVAPMVPLP